MFDKLFMPKRWESTIAILEDNIFTSDTQRWVEVITNLKDVGENLNQGPPSGTAERRKEPRFALSLPVQHRIKGHDAHWKSGESIDVSQNGIRLAVNAPICVGTRLELDIKLPHEDQPIKLGGVVVWTKVSSNGKSAIECGVAFDNLRKVGAKEKIIGFMADRLCGIVLKQTDDMTCRPAETQDDLNQAYRIVYEGYVHRGYCKENESGLHYNYFSLLPSSRTFLLEMDGRVVGTISLIVDSPCGLPMEQLFTGEIGRFRKEGRKLAEVSLLALDHHAFGHKSFTLTDMRKLAASFRLFKMMLRYAQFIGITDLMIAMHPKHKELYSYLTFETIGPVRNYAGAEGNPALPMRLDFIRSMLCVAKEWVTYRYFMCEPIPKEILERHFEWDSESAWRFLSGYRGLWAKIPPAHQEHIKTIYPEIIGKLSSL